MTKIALLGGAYTARSKLAEAQRCVNLFPEQNPSDSPFPTTHYQTPGLSLQFTTTDGGPIRLIYRDSHSNLYVVSGPNVYGATFATATGWTLKLIGMMNSTTSPVRATDNGADCIFVDGTADGWTLNIANQTWAQIFQAGWYGSQAADVVDTFMLFCWPGNGEMYTTLAQSTTFDPTYFAAKSGAPDPVQVIAAVHKEIWMFGTDTSEVWYDAGGVNFPFARIPGVFIQQGIAAIYSVAKANENVFWIGRGPQGTAMAYMGANYQANPIATAAIVYEWQGYSTISDAIGFTYQIGTHIFYVVTFPTADKTWVYDVVTQMWHEWRWMDPAGVLHRHRANTYVFTGTQHLVGDWENGNVYALDPTVYTDNGAQILRIRSFPHIQEGDDNARQFFHEFTAAVEVGQGPPGGQMADPAPVMNLRYSDDGGNTWGTRAQRSIGRLGEFIRNVQWQRLGHARDRVFELSWSAPIRTSLNGAFVRFDRGRT